MNESVEQFYKKFVQRVADGRNMTWEQVNEVAQGRVWTGKDALKIGLVDEIGSLDDVITYASKELKLKEYNIISYPEIKLEFKQLLRNKFGIFAKDEIHSIIKDEIGEENYNFLQKIKEQSKIKPYSIEAQIPYLIQIK